MGNADPDHRAIEAAVKRWWGQRQQHRAEKTRAALENSTPRQTDPAGASSEHEHPRTP